MSCSLRLHRETVAECEKFSSKPLDQHLCSSAFSQLASEDSLGGMPGQPASSQRNRPVFFLYVISQSDRTLGSVVIGSVALWESTDWSEW